MTDRFDSILTACVEATSVGTARSTRLGINRSAPARLNSDAAANATGTSAISVPLHWMADGLPVGVHFAGRYDEEATSLALAAELEAAQPWFNRVPAL